jgi:hypothetical protein
MGVRSRCEIGIRLRKYARCDLAQCCTGFEEGGILSDTFWEMFFFGGSSSSEEDRSSAAGCPISRVFCEKWATKCQPHRTHPNFPGLLADAELSNDRLIALGIVSFEVVEQATPLADQHEQAAA